jgi:hypothetical protein
VGHSVAISVTVSREVVTFGTANYRGVKLLEPNPDLKLREEEHTDNQGSAAGDSSPLGEKRARSRAGLANRRWNSRRAAYRQGLGAGPVAR